jgi:hypothetical protein
VDEATFTEVRDHCSAGKTYEVLQYVFLGTAVVTGGIGAYILLTSDASESASRPGRLALRPRVGASGAALTASLTF